MSSTLSPACSSTTLPVGEEHDAVGGRGRRRVVRDHDDRLAELVDGAPEQVEHVAPGGGVEVAGRLVGEDDGRARDQRARDGDPLLLAAGELRRPVRAAVAEPDGLDQRLEPGGVDVLARDAQRQEHVLLGGEDREQVVALEDEADLRAAQQRELVVAEGGELACRRSRPTRWSAGRARRGCASASTCRSPTGP